MKRYYLIIMIGLLFVTNLASAAITVKFQKPASWTAVSLYTWGPEALGGWPGTALTEDNGWYSYTFEESFTGANLIFNNAGAGEQTEDFVISSSVCLQASSTLNVNGKYDVTVVPCSESGWTVKFHKPESWTAVSLYTWGPEVLGGWPGAALTEVDGWYTYTFDASFTGANLIFNNAGAGQQTEDYLITGDVCLEASSTLNGNGKYDVTVVPCATPGIEVKFIKPQSWTAVSLYTWGPEVLGGWPGASLTETEGWYTYTFDSGFTGANLIFNNAGAGEQTEDYTISSSVCLQASSTLNGNGKYDVTVVPCTTGIDELNRNQVSIYPNPVGDNMMLSGFGRIEKGVIRSLTGEQVLTFGSLSNKGIIEVRSLKPGVYFVTITLQDGKQLVEKMVKL
ncbi:MAG: starch-binding protein [Omnitrophica WOR_2 bacterium]|jgi:hypothetical protein